MPGASRDAPGASRNVSEDATRRTHLANERTYLAWWRTGLGSLAAGVGAGRIVPALTGGARWPYAITGAGFALLGILCIGYAYLRHREVQAALERGEFRPSDDRVIAVLTAGGTLLGLLVVALVVIEG